MSMNYRTWESEKEDESAQELTLYCQHKPVVKEDNLLDELERLKRQEKDANDAAEALRKEFAQETKNLLIQVGAAKASSTNIVNTVDAAHLVLPESVVNVSPIPTSRIHSIHPSTLILGDPKSAVQTRSKVTKSSGAHAFISEALEDESWVDAMQEELLQFKIQKVWILVDLPYGKKAIGTKWVYRNKKDEEELLSRNKASTPIETLKLFSQDEKPVNLYAYALRSIDWFLLNVLDCLLAVILCLQSVACSRFQVTSKTSHLSVVKRIFSQFEEVFSEKETFKPQVIISGSSLEFRESLGRALEIMDFLNAEFHHHSLTKVQAVSTTFVEQFWTSAKSKIINNVRHITAKVAGKPVSISEASIRSDLLFDDVDGIDSLPNQAIFDAIQLMG
ncbi:hypothetical protein Tco_1235699 [Tanacetum coccineum]